MVSTHLHCLSFFRSNNLLHTENTKMVINHWWEKNALNKWEIHTFLIAPSDLSPVLVTHIDSETKTKEKDYNPSH